MAMALAMRFSGFRGYEMEIVATILMLLIAI
jgi:hypothetical protein